MTTTATRLATVLAILAPLMISAPAAAVDCHASKGAGPRWSWRHVDGRRCWYRGPRNLDRAKLHWPAPKPKPAPKPAPQPPVMDATALAAALASAARARMAAESPAEPILPTPVPTVSYVQPRRIALNECPDMPAPPPLAGPVPSPWRGLVLAFSFIGFGFALGLAGCYFTRNRIRVLQGS